MLQYYSFNGQKKKSHCCCGGTQKKKGCCKTEHCKVKVDDNQSMSKNLLFEKQLVIEAIIPLRTHIFKQDIKTASISYAVPLAHPPPLIRTVPLRILHQQILI
jgi:hypothetical protein